MAKLSAANVDKIRFREAAAPATPDSGYGYLYVKSDGKIYFKNDAGTEIDLSSVVSTAILKDGSVAFTGDQSLGTNRLTNVSDPGSAQDAATKNYVDSNAANLGKRARARAATTANITIATALNNGDTLDGVSLVTGDLVLVKDQTAAEQNGIYVVGVSPARFAEFDTYDEHPGSLIAVQEGTANEDTVWLCTSNLGGVLNTNDIDFSSLGTGGTVEALTTSENDTSKRLAPDGAGGVAWAAGGGSISQAYVGYNTIGASWETLTARRVYLKQITLASDTQLMSIDMYLRPSTDNLTGLRVMVLTDNAGAPDVLIAQGSGTRDGDIYLSNSASMPGAGRWLSIPLGVYLPAGTYWIAFVSSNAFLDVAYDGSGSDQYFTPSGYYATGAYPSAWAITTGARKYSIRAGTIS
jgi:hypothetical protein